MFKYIHFLESNRFSHFILYRCSEFRVIFNQKIPSKTKQNSNMKTKVFTVQAEKLEKKESAPLANYEKSVTVIKLPDGRMRLVNQ